MKQFIFIISLLMYMTACTEKQNQNPFFVEWESPFQIPPFERITVENYREAFIKGMKEQESEIEAIINNSETASFQNTIVAFDASGQLLTKVINVFFAQSNANGTKEILELESEIIPLLTQHSNKIMMNPQLFERISFVKEDIDFSILTAEETTLLNDLHLEFVRNGVTLPEAERAKLKEVNERISVLQNKFAQNLLIETASYQLIINKKEDLANLSEDAIQAAANRAEKAGLSGKWLFGLDNPSIMPFLFFNNNPALRKEIFTAYLNRCNNDNEFDNKDVLKEIVILRDNKANLLNYTNFAAFVLERRMAKNTENVYRLLDQIWTPAIQKAKEELAEMQLLREDGSELKSSDWRFYSQKLKQQKYNLSDEELRPYFKAENVRDGIFWLTNQLYGISFKELANVPKPHEDAEVFLCLDADGVTELGVLFIDLYARPGLKRGGAWCGTYRDAAQNAEGKRIKPLTYIVCNFSPPLGNEPALLTPEEVETFYHEFGHALHNLFTNVRFNLTREVPRDFVELPSQNMEHWAFQPKVLANYAKHYQTNEVIPQDLVDKMQISSKYGQGFATTEYVAASYLDMDYHVNPSPKTINVLEFEANTLNNRGLIPQIPPRYRSTYFQHTFTGGYAAGYYSYIWSEVLDCDAFEAFVESGNIFNQEIANRFRKYILEPGGIYPADTMYQNFRGQEPTIQGLLRNRGLTH